MDGHRAHSPLVDSLCTAIGHLQVWRQPLTASSVKPAAQPGVAAAWSALSSSGCFGALRLLYAGSLGSCRRQIVAVFSPDKQLDSVGAQALLVLAPYVIGESPCAFSCDIMPPCQSNQTMQHSSGSSIPHAAAQESDTSDDSRLLSCGGACTAVQGLAVRCQGH